MLSCIGEGRQNYHVEDDRDQDQDDHLGQDHHHDHYDSLRLCLCHQWSTVEGREDKKI